MSLSDNLLPYHFALCAQIGVERHTECVWRLGFVGTLVCSTLLTKFDIVEEDLNKKEKPFLRGDVKKIGIECPQTLRYWRRETPS